MDYKAILRQQKAEDKATNKVATTLNPIAMTILAFIFIGMLALSSMNDYLFFGWLAMGSSIVFALVGIHLLGKQQVKRD